METPVWTEGQESWLALKDMSELYGQLYYISSNGQSIPPREEALAASGATTSQIIDVPPPHRNRSLTARDGL